MIRINLLPFRADRKKENIRRQVSIFLLSLAFMLIILFYFNFSLNSKIDKLNANVKNTKSDLAKFEKINKEIAEIKKKLDNLKKKIAVMDTLEANRFEPTRLMDTMTQVIVPRRMWFTRLISKGKKVSISGVALDNTTVADFMIRLENFVCTKKPLIEPKKKQKIAKAKAKK
jgi:type IV pilus assembly protein PilN